MADTRRGLMKRDVRSGRSTGFAGRSVRRGFTLIEVIVAMSILVVVVLALVSSYYGYYGSVMRERYKTIGGNLAQLQLEDIRGMSVGVLSQIVGEGATSAGYGYYPYPNPDASNPSNVTDPAYLSDNYRDWDPRPDVFDSHEVGGKFRIYKLTGVGVEGLSSLSLPGVGVETVSGSGSPTYNVVLYEYVYPGYTKQVIITDETPGVSGLTKKLFKIEVTVFWWSGGVKRHVTVTGLTNDSGVS